jgi:hypothetical protein
MSKLTLSVSQPARATTIAATNIAARTSPSRKKSALRSLLEVGALTALLFGASACNGPCEELAKKICECELSQAAQNQCEEQVRSAMDGRDVTEQENAVCEAALDTCSCDTLEQDKLAACGLAK